MKFILVGEQNWESIFEILFCTLLVAGTTTFKRKSWKPLHCNITKNNDSSFIFLFKLILLYKTIRNLEDIHNYDMRLPFKTAFISNRTV